MPTDDRGDAHEFRPHAYVPNCVAYTATHDNDTTVGWFRRLDPEGAERKFALRYLASDGDEIHWDCIRAVMASVAETVIVPLQDVLGLGSDARMNCPGTHGSHNWSWRLQPGWFSETHHARLRELCTLYARI